VESGSVVVGKHVGSGSGRLPPEGQGITSEGRCLTISDRTIALVDPR
jgi:hypothetical protein